MSERGVTCARAASIALIAGCGSSGPASFTGNGWLANEIMTESCESTTSYQVGLWFAATATGIEYRDPVVHCFIDLAVEGNTATLVGQPTGCSTIIAAQVAPIEISDATLTSDGSRLSIAMNGTATVGQSTCAITIAAGAVR